MPLITVGDLKAYRVVNGLCAIEIGSGYMSSPAYLQLGTAMKSVGLVDGTVEISPNQEIHTLSASNMSGPHQAFESNVAWRVTFSLQEFDIWNLALALSYTESDVSASTSLAIDHTPGITVSGGKYMSLLVKHYSVPNSDFTPASSYTSQFEFFKVKLVFNGAVTFEKSSPTRLPVVAHCLHNDMDQVGQYKTSISIINRNYEGTI